MRKNCLVLLSVIMLMSCGHNSKENGNASSVQAVDTGKAVISFSSYEHDFGTINDGEVVGCFFQFTNTGTGSLVINSANASCGCTVPKFDNKPILPGGSGTVEVKFDATGRGGHQTKTITVMSNADPEVVILKISADVI